METADRANPFTEEAEASWRTACHEPLAPEGETADEAVLHEDGQDADDSPNAA